MKRISLLTEANLRDHKSRDSKFGAGILPLLPQHFTMLYRNLIYTGLTRARRVAVLVGSRWALRRVVD